MSSYIIQLLNRRFKKTKEPTECVCGCHYCGYRNMICGLCYRTNCKATTRNN